MSDEVGSHLSGELLVLQFVLILQLPEILQEMPKSKCYENEQFYLKLAINRKCKEVRFLEVLTRFKPFVLHITTNINQTESNVQPHYPNRLLLRRPYRI